MYDKLRKESKILNDTTERDEDFLRELLHQLDFPDRPGGKIDKCQVALNNARAAWKKHLFDQPGYFPKEPAQGQFKIDIETAEAMLKIVEQEYESVMDRLFLVLKEKKKAEKDAKAGTSRTTKYNELAGKGDPLTEFAGRPVFQDQEGRDRFKNKPRELVSTYVAGIKDKRRAERNK